MIIVIFACIHNAGRSQMAAAWFNNFVDPKKVRAISAGTQPGEKVHPSVVAVMNEVGIDLANAKPQLLTGSLAQQASLLVTMGCGEACPVVPGLHREDWPLQDPKGLTLAQVRMIRDDIKQRVSSLTASRGWLHVDLHR